MGSADDRNEQRPGWGKWLGWRGRRSFQPIPEIPVDWVESARRLDSKFNKQLWYGMAVSEEDYTEFGKILGQCQIAEVRDLAVHMVWRMGNVLGYERSYRDEDPLEVQIKLCTKYIEKNIPGMAALLEAELGGDTVEDSMAVVTAVRYMDVARGNDLELLKVLRPRAEQVYDLLGQDNEYRAEAGMFLGQLASEGSFEGKNFSSQKLRQMVINPNQMTIDEAKEVAVLFDPGHYFYGNAKRLIQAEMTGRLTKMGFNETEMRRRWDFSPVYSRGIGEITELVNLRIMQGIEAKVSNGAWKLNNDWGISNFARFSVEFWVKMLEDADNVSQPWVVELMAVEDDGDYLSRCSFSMGADKQAMGMVRDLWRHGYAYRVIEALNTQELDRIGQQIQAEEYVGAEAFVINTHGEDGRIFLGPGGGEIAVTDILNGKLGLTKIVREGAPGIVEACFGERVARALGDKVESEGVIGQRESGIMYDIQVIYNETGGISAFQATALSGVTEYKQERKR